MKTLGIIQNGYQIKINDMACITWEFKQYRFPKQKSHRRTKKWAKNKRNFRSERVHQVVLMGNVIFVSSKMFEDLKNLPDSKEI